MNSVRPFVIVIGLILSAHVASAQDQDRSRYRAYVLESNLESVIAASGTRATSVKILHERPARIQELQWRAPYADFRNAQADPVREMGEDRRPRLVLDALCEGPLPIDALNAFGRRRGSLRFAHRAFAGLYGFPSA